MMEYATERYTIRQEGEEYRLELAGDWKTATVTHESGTAASIVYRLNSYRTCVLHMSAEAGSMRDAVDIAVSLIQTAMEEEEAA